MARLIAAISAVSDFLWHDYALLTLLGVGVLFTLWSGFAQYRGLTHGVAVIRGRYNRAGDPGAITHLQALSAALSATVGLGNIAGVAIAVTLGGPGAVFWMWVTGLFGMAVKMTEVIQSMIHRDTTDPLEPHGGPMFVCRNGFARLFPKLAPAGAALGAIFCVSLLVCTATGGNMFQAWNVADISFSYFGVPRLVSGAIMTILVGLVILGGIRRIGAVAEALVPFMCALYLVGGIWVIVSRLDQVPGMLRLVFQSAFAPAEAAGAFLGGSVGFAFLKGMQRALFSNEAGQGSAPIAHAASRTDEPARQGVVACLEPFVDTIVVCSITAAVILLSGTWNRPPALAFDAPPMVDQVTDFLPGSPGMSWTLRPTPVSVRGELEARDQMFAGQEVFAVMEAHSDGRTGRTRHRLNGTLKADPDGGWHVQWRTLETPHMPRVAVEGVYFDFKGATLTAKAFDSIHPGLGFWIVPAAAWLFAISTLISWCYYGEQGIVYLIGARAVTAYRIVYCLLILAAASPLIRTQHELDVISSLGTGVMLWANLPIMLIFAPQAMSAYHDYIRRLKAGKLEPTRR